MPLDAHLHSDPVPKRRIRRTAEEIAERKKEAERLERRQHQLEKQRDAIRLEIICALSQEQSAEKIFAVLEKLTPPLDPEMRRQFLLEHKALAVHAWELWTGLRRSKEQFMHRFNLNASLLHQWKISWPVREMLQTGRARPRSR